MATFDLPYLVRLVAHTRERKAQLDAQWAEALAVFEEVNQVLKSDRDTYANILRDAEAQLKATALAQYNLDHNAAPVPGVTIKLFAALTYDESVALAWAKESGLALALDTKAFEKIAKATPIPGVSITQEPKATVATNLDAALTALDATEGAPHVR